MKNYALRRLPVVARDLAEAGEWYEEQNPGIGLADALDSEVDAAILALRTSAAHHRVRFRDVRRAPLKHFPFYGIYYVLRGNDVIVIAIFHDRRDRTRLRQRRRTVAGDL